MQKNRHRFESGIADLEHRIERLNERLAGDPELSTAWARVMEPLERLRAAADEVTSGELADVEAARQTETRLNECYALLATALVTAETAFNLALETLRDFAGEGSGDDVTSETS